MADRPIIFSAPMIRALLDGRKTQTRRILREQPGEGVGAWRVARTPGGNACYEWRSKFGAYLGDVCRVYGVGDRLWCREAWRTAAAYDDLAPSQMGGEEPIFYEADGERRTWGHPVTSPKGRLRASMHMPRWASRLTLIVTDVRVQRLQEISEEDAIAEGMMRDNVPGSESFGAWSGGIDFLYGWDAQGAFRRTWEIINGPGAWESNPWVAAYTFSVHKANIDSPANEETSP